MKIKVSNREIKKKKGFYIFINARHPDFEISKVWSLGPFPQAVTIEKMIGEFTTLKTKDLTHEYFNRGTSWVHGFLIDYYTVSYVNSEGLEYECGIQKDG